MSSLGLLGPLMEFITRSSQLASQAIREKEIAFSYLLRTVLARPVGAPFVSLCRFFISHKGLTLSILSVGLIGQLARESQQSQQEVQVGLHWGRHQPLESILLFLAGLPPLWCEQLHLVQEEALSQSEVGNLRGDQTAHNGLLGLKRGVDLLGGGPQGLIGAALYLPWLFSLSLPAGV